MKESSENISERKSKKDPETYQIIISEINELLKKTFSSVPQNLDDLELFKTALHNKEPYKNIYEKYYNFFNDFENEFSIIIKKEFIKSYLPAFQKNLSLEKNLSNITNISNTLVLLEQIMLIIDQSPKLAFESNWNTEIKNFLAKLADTFPQAFYKKRIPIIISSDKFESDFDETLIGNSEKGTRGLLQSLYSILIEVNFSLIPNHINPTFDPFKSKDTKAILEKFDGLNKEIGDYISSRQNLESLPQKRISHQQNIVKIIEETCAAENKLIKQQKQLQEEEFSKLNFRDIFGILRKRNPETIEIEHMLNKCDDINIKDEDGYTALILAAQKGYKNVVEKLLEKGADVNLKNKDGLNALELIALKRNEYELSNIAELLFKNGAVISAENLERILNQIIENNATSIAQIIFKKYASAISGKLGSELLVSSTKKFRREIIDLLFENGAKPAFDENGNSPLIIATMLGFNPLVKSFIKKGSEVNHKNKYGYSPLFIAINNWESAPLNYIDIAQYLIYELNTKREKNWLEENFKTAYGFDGNILDYTIHKKCPEIIETLIESGAKSTKYSPENCQKLIQELYVKRAKMLSTHIEEKEINRRTKGVEAVIGKDSFAPVKSDYGIKINDKFQGVCSISCRGRRTAQEDSECIAPIDESISEYIAIKALSLTIKKAEEEVESQRQEDGSTVTAAVIFKAPADDKKSEPQKKVAIANLGDSRTYIVRNVNGKLKLIPQTKDHNPDNPQEKDRIEKCGQPVYGDRVNGLAVSRSIGDTAIYKTAYGEKIVGSHTEEITLRDLGKDDRFLLHICDGICEVLSDDSIEKILERFSDNPKSIAKSIIQASFHGGSSDNLSVLVTDLSIDYPTPIITAAFDGHGGHKTSKYLGKNFPRIYQESVKEVREKQQESKQNQSPSLQTPKTPEPSHPSPSPLPIAEKTHVAAKKEDQEIGKPL